MTHPEHPRHTEQRPGAIARLTTPVRCYAWGSRTQIARLQQRPAPTAEPEAELWIGAHPIAPSRLVDDGSALTDAIAAAPTRILGEGVVGHFGPRLPFLLKVLAAEAPLSLQAHPSAELAAAGFAAEEAAGIPLDAPHRVYRDPWAKPELLCALTPFVALCGFRPVADTLALLDRLAAPCLGPTAATLRERGEAGLLPVVRELLMLPGARRRDLVAELAHAVRRLAASADPDARLAAVVADLTERYPTDTGCAVALLLNLVELQPGQGVHLPTGGLHTYIGGTGVELMATSDNVLRGGLTSKHVDVEGLLAVLDAEAGPPPLIHPVELQPGEHVYPTPTPQFRLSRLEPTGRALRLQRRGVEVLLCTEGAIVVGADGCEETLGPGEAVLVTADAGDVEVRGTGTAFRATVGEDAPAGSATR